MNVNLEHVVFTYVVEFVREMRRHFSSVRFTEHIYRHLLLSIKQIILPYCSIFYTFIVFDSEHLLLLPSLTLNIFRLMFGEIGHKSMRTSKAVTRPYVLQHQTSTFTLVRLYRQAPRYNTGTWRTDRQNCYIIFRDGVLEDCPRDRGQLEDPKSWPWPWPGPWPLSGLALASMHRPPVTGL